jgi:hypothetical protein
MSQSDIFELLKNKRLSGDGSYYTSEEIRSLLKEKNIIVLPRNLNNGLSQLRKFGYLECRIEVNGRKRRKCLCSAYRLRRESIE